MENKKIGVRIEQRRKEKGLTLDDIAQEIGVARSTVQRYEKGTIEKIKLPVLEAIARALDVNPAWLCFKSDKMEPTKYDRPFPANIVPLPQMREWKVLGATACGKPLHRELLDETVMAPDDVKADVVFRCVGDSMINARIFDGDAVFVRLQPEVENGQIAVVRVDDEFTLKRVYFHEDYVELRPENPVHKAIILRGHQLEPEYFEVVGLAAAFMSVIQ